MKILNDNNKKVICIYTQSFPKDKIALENVQEDSS